MVKLRPRFRRPNHATHLIWWQMSSIAIIVEAIWLDIILQVSTCGDLTSRARRLGLELAPILSQADVAIYRIYSPFCAKGCRDYYLEYLKGSNRKNTRSDGYDFDLQIHSRDQWRAAPWLEICMYSRGLGALLAQALSSISQSNEAILTRCYLYIFIQYASRTFLSSTCIKSILTSSPNPSGRIGVVLYSVHKGYGYWYITPWDIWVTATLTESHPTSQRHTKHILYMFTTGDMSCPCLIYHCWSWPQSFDL